MKTMDNTLQRYDASQNDNEADQERYSIKIILNSKAE